MKIIGRYGVTTPATTPVRVSVPVPIHASTITTLRELVEEQLIPPFYSCCEFEIQVTTEMPTTIVESDNIIMDLPGFEVTTYLIESTNLAIIKILGTLTVSRHHHVPIGNYIGLAYLSPHHTLQKKDIDSLPPRPRKTLSARVCSPSTANFVIDYVMSSLHLFERIGHNYLRQYLQNSSPIAKCATAFELDPVIASYIQNSQSSPSSYIDVVFDGGYLDDYEKIGASVNVMIKKADEGGFICNKHKNQTCEIMPFQSWIHHDHVDYAVSKVSGLQIMYSMVMVFDESLGEISEDIPKPFNAHLIDFIHVFDVPFPANLLEDILLEYSDRFSQARIGDDGECDLSIRNCRTWTIQDPFNLNENIYAIIQKALDDVLRQYNKLHPMCMCEINSDVTILEYKKGGLYAEHTDQSSNFNRAISISILLNDDFEGGEIAFFNRQYIPKVTKYQAIVFPANFAYPHEVLPIHSGTRYSLIAWAS